MLKTIRKLKNHQWILLSHFFLVPLSMRASAEAPSTDVPLHHPVYRYLAMLPLPGRVGDISLSTRPYTEAQVCSLLVYAQKKGLVRDTAPSRFYLQQFSRSADDAPVQPVPALFKFDEFRTIAYPYFVNAFNLQDSNFTRPGFTAISVDSVKKANEAFNANAVGLRMISRYKTAMFYFDASINTAYSTLRTWEKAMDPHRGIFQRSHYTARF